MAHAKQGDTVQVHYRGKLADGTIVSDTFEHEPAQFTIGESRQIPGLEQAVIGMIPGESKTVTISSDQAYGPHDEALVVAVKRDQAFPESFQPEVGQRLRMRQEDGQKILVTVVDVSEKSVMLDINHPLAGKDLTFDILLIEIA